MSGKQIRLFLVDGTPGGLTTAVTMLASKTARRSVGVMFSSSSAVMIFDAMAKR